MSWIDFVGYLASLSVLATFCMGSMASLRVIGIMSNALFITYGLGEHLYPVLLLHTALLPINVLKVVQLRRRALPDHARARQDGAGPIRRILQQAR